jgi:hypothetical protein
MGHKAKAHSKKNAAEKNKAKSGSTQHISIF